MKFDNVTNITCVGNAPALFGGNVLLGVAAGAKVYYYSGTSGWGATYGGRLTVRLYRPQLVGPIGVQAGGLGFTITAGTNQTILLEASTNLVNWQPIWTNTLSGTSTNFTDADWINYPHRFYRAR